MPGTAWDMGTELPRRRLLTRPASRASVRQRRTRTSGGRKDRRQVASREGAGSRPGSLHRKRWKQRPAGPEALAELLLEARAKGRARATGQGCPEAGCRGEDKGNARSSRQGSAGREGDHTSSAFQKRNHLEIPKDFRCREHPTPQSPEEAEPCKHF